MVNSKADELEGKTAMKLVQQIRIRRTRRRFQQREKVKFHNPKKKKKKKKAQKKTQMETEEDDEMERKRLRYKGQINREKHGKRRILRLGVFFFILFFLCVL